MYNHVPKPKQTVRINARFIRVLKVGHNQSRHVSFSFRIRGKCTQQKEYTVDDWSFLVPDDSSTAKQLKFRFAYHLPSINTH